MAAETLGPHSFHRSTVPLSPNVGTRRTCLPQLGHQTDRLQDGREDAFTFSRRLGSGSWSGGGLEGEGTQLGRGLKISSQNEVVPRERPQSSCRNRHGYQAFRAPPGSSGIPPRSSQAFHFQQWSRGVSHRVSGVDGTSTAEPSGKPPWSQTACAPTRGASHSRSCN